MGLAATAPAPRYTLNPQPYTLHLTPYTLHPTPYTLHLTPYTHNPTPYTIHPTPSDGRGRPPGSHGPGRLGTRACRVVSPLSHTPDFFFFFMTFEPRDE